MRAAPPRRPTPRARRGFVRRHLASLLLVPAAAAALFAGWALWPEHFDPNSLGPALVPEVLIRRDTWGVPHIYGQSDPDVAFGLAYAHAEDDFGTIQRALLAARGRLAEALGPQGAPNDYLVALLRIGASVEAGYARDLSADTRALCEGYAAGLNHYARTHPDEVLPGLFPATGQDVVAGFVHKLPLFFGLHLRLGELLRGAPEPTRAPPPGSNTIALGPSRSAEGHTRLLINSHQPWEGPVAWYEAHLHSEQGWNAYGGLFPGAPVILHGFNPELGWAHTVNHPDLLDVYRLQTDPQHPDAYLFDGAWRELERGEAHIRVRLLGRFSWTVTRETLWSAYGPVVRGPEGTFALRAAGLGDVGAVEQWYRMNKARGLDEWKQAVRAQALPMFNCGYADASGNIYYLYNARLPLRAPGFDWTSTVPGNTSDTLWSEYLPFERLPQVENPASGFVQNCNSSPFRTTLGPENPDASRYAPAFGIETHMTNRALRVLELLDDKAPLDDEAWRACKFDQAYSTRSSLARALRALLLTPEPADPELRAARALLRGWDLGTGPHSRAAALALQALSPDERNGKLDPEAAAGRLRETARGLERLFGRIDPELQELQRLRRGPVDLGLGGAPDVLAALYTERARDGRRVGVAGDSLILLVEWDRQGRVSARALQPYGSATARPASPHYADQAALFARRELRPVWFELGDVQAHLEREYRPGQ